MITGVDTMFYTSRPGVRGRDRSRAVKLLTCLSGLPCASALADGPAPKGVNRAGVGRLLPRFPDFPDFADEVGAGFEGHFARLPFGRGGLGSFRLADELEGVYLAQGFVDISSDGRGHDFVRLHDAVGVDEESSADVDSHVFVVDAVDFAEVPSLVGDHGEGDSAGVHFGELFFVPDFVNELRIDRDREHMDIEFLQRRIFGGDRRQFGRSDKGEVAGVEAEHDPVAQRIGEFDAFEGTFVVRGGFEIGGFAPNLDSHGTDLLWRLELRVGGGFAGVANHPTGGASAADRFSHTDLLGAGHVARGNAVSWI